MQQRKHQYPASNRLILIANPVVALALVAIVLLLLIGHFSLRQIRLSQEQVLAEHLESSLNATAELLSYWRRQSVANTEVLGESPRGYPMIRDMLLAKEVTPEQREAFRYWLYPIISKLGFDGYSLIDPQRKIRDASSQDYIGIPVATPESHAALDKTLPGISVVSMPTVAYLPTDGTRGPMPVGSFFQNVCMYIADQDQHLGYLCLRFNSESGFFPLVISGRSGSTGDIYAINSEGRILTPPRFLPEGLNKLETARTWSHWLAQPPGEGKELTQLAQALLKDTEVQVRMNYPDYRGVQVVGAGRWLPDWGMGLIVEQDMAEAFDSYYVARRVILGLSVSAIVLILVLTIGAVINRRLLAEREGHFRSLMNHIPNPVYMRALDGSLTVVNPAFSQLVHLHKSELLGRHLLDLPVPKWLTPLVTAAEAMTHSDLAQEQRLSLCQPSGDSLHYRLVNFPVTYARGAPPQAVACIIMDETAQVNASEQQLAMNQHLEELVTERTRELLHAKDEALAASRAKAEFLANMSHEIRTPLNAIIGLAHVSLATEVSGKLRSYLEKMRVSGEHLLEVINDILSFSRLEAGKLRPDDEEFLLADVVERSVTLIREKALSKGLTLNVTLAEDLPPRFLGDPLRISQILINLCVNAVKFTEKGRVDLRVTTGVRRGNRQELIFAVEDTGIGIEPELLPSLFQPFHQVDNSSARRFEGTGLGLAISKRLASLMNAQLEVESELGKGSCFRLRVSLALPASPLPAASLAPLMPQQPLQGKILVVEDNLLNQEIMRSLLEVWGLEVSLAITGTDALTHLQARWPDLVLMDIQLPGMDGVETTAQIRNLPGGTDLPVVAVTAHALPGDREHYLASGMDDYLSKPVNPHKLHAMLVRWLNRKSESLFTALQEQGMDVQGALFNLMNNQDLYRRLLTGFARERADLPARLVQALDSGDDEVLLDHVHSLNSLAASLGMVELHAMASRSEQALRSGRRDVEALDNLGREVRRMVTLIESWLAQIAH